MSDYPDDRKSVTAQSAPASIPGRAIFLVVGFLQGLLLYGIGEYAWLEHNPVLGYPLRLLAWAWPVLFLLTYRPNSARRGVAWVSAFAFLLALLAAYIGWQATPHGKIVTNSLENVFIATTLVVGFVALLHLQAAIWRLGREYDLVFTLSWRNFLTVSLSSALTLVVWLVLFLWGLLFSAVGVESFSDLFAENWFRFPVLATVFAFGLFSSASSVLDRIASLLARLHSFSSASSVLDRIASLLARLIWILLPLTVLVTTVFLLCIPAIGLQPLVDSDRGPLLLMTINLVTLFFLNAVYQTGVERPYALLIHRLISVGLALLPVLSALSLYALFSRVSDYGWTPGRCWAAFVLSLAGLFSVAYTYFIGSRWDAWPGRLSQVNKRMSWVVLIALMLANSPPLDFRAVSARSLFARIESGEVALDAFSMKTYGLYDLHDVRRQLARPGYLSIQALAASLGETDPKRARWLRVFIGDEEDPAGWTEAQQQQIVLRPETFDIPLGLVEAMKVRRSDTPQVLFRVELGGDTRYEYVSVHLEEDARTFSAYCWQYAEENWRSCGSDTYMRAGSPDRLYQEFSTADFEAIAPDTPYKNLRVGEQLLDFN